MTHPTRREFLAGAAAGLTILPSARSLYSAEANDRLNLAVFGTMYNSAHMLFAPHIYNTGIVALCDPDERNIAKALIRWKDMAGRLESSKREADRAWAAKYRRIAEGHGVKIYSDIRKMFDQMGESIDALVVSNYDHFHGVACGPALRARMPVLSERPVGLTISDARKLRQLAVETKLPTTYRSPGTGHGQFRRAMELVEDGFLGQVKEVHIWFDRGGPSRAMLPQGTQPIPKELDWDSWLGPLPQREYHPDWMAYSNWRETCNGGLGTFGPHTTIFPFMTLQLRKLWDEPKGKAPIQVSAECEKLNRISFPRWERIRWDVPARGTMPALTVTWHHGPGFAPGARELIHQKLREVGVKTPEAADALMGKAGSLLVGSEGAMVANDHSVQVTPLPKEKFQEIETKHPQRIPGARGIYRDWIDACRGEKSHIIANFHNGGPLSEFLMLGNLATLYPEETLAYDPAIGQITNKPAANEHLGFEYREGWSL